MMIRTIFVAIACTGLVACAAGRSGPSKTDRSRAAGEFLERLEVIADPGKVVATDFAFARAARDNGQWTAFREYAASGAMLDAPGGLVSVSSLLADPPQSITWAPNIAWSSCDGSLAVSSGRFREASGAIGTYVTAWQLQRGGDYRWTYNAGVLDNPQPVARPSLETPEGDDVIVVAALEAIEGKTADCPASDGVAPAPPHAVMADTSEYETIRSADGTLQYRWENRANGDRNVMVEYLRDGGWEIVLDLAIPAETAG